MPSIDDPVLNSLPTATMDSKSCIGCGRELPVTLFARDSSYRDGRRDLCDICASTPRMSTEEHTWRLREANYCSEAVRKQRWRHQRDFENDEARTGRQLHPHEFLRKLRNMIPPDRLFITEGNVIGDLALYRIYGQPQPELNGNTFKYVCYMPTSYNLPECSLIEFNRDDVPVRDKKRGWRTVLLRFVKAGITTEEACRKEFGEPLGVPGVVYRREMFIHRNGHEPS